MDTNNEVRSFQDFIKAKAVEAKLKGKGLTFFAARYAYAGKVTEVGEDYIVLDGAELPFETGVFSDKGFKNSEKFPHGEWTLMIGAIESFGVMK